MPNCAAADHSKTDVPADATTVLCVTSHEEQTVRAVISAALPGGTTILASSEPIKFSGGSWWKSTIMTSALMALLGTVFGLVSTLVAQNADRLRKAKDERHTLAVEQEQFLLRNLLPELVDHLRVLAANDARPPDEFKKVESLPKQNVVETVGGPRAERLASYFDSLKVKDTLADVQRYAEVSEHYNDSVEETRRGRMSLDELRQRGERIRAQLRDLGFAT
jgi:hypothetical protein